MRPRSRMTARSVKPRILRAFCSTTIADIPSLRMTSRKHAQQLLDDDRRQPLQRLVQQHQARIDDQRAADRQHLLLAAGQLAAEIAAPLRQPREHREHALQRPRPGRATAVRFSSTVSERKMLRSCGDQPMPAATRRSGRSRVMSRPSRRMLPALCVVRPTSELISVVLPVPLRPSSASGLAVGDARSRCRRARRPRRSRRTGPRPAAAQPWPASPR